MTKVIQSPEDLKRHLQEQLGFLQRSADAYDQGYTDEAKRLAVTIRVLVQDSKASKSLLEQLGEKTRKFYDTAVPDDPGNVMSYGGLVQISMDASGAKYIPNLDDLLDIAKPREVLFDEWWSQPVFRNDNGKILTRSDLVRSVSDQDGGAHVDPGLNEVYARLSRECGMGWVYSGPAGVDVVQAPELAAVRQIAHEVIKTFNPSYGRQSRHLEGSILFGGTSLREATPEEIARLESRQNVSTAIPPSATGKGRKIGRNEPCPCGSGIKYKKCHGRA
jgi:hypothetical protein